MVVVISMYYFFYDKKYVLWLDKILSKEYYLK